MDEELKPCPFCGGHAVVRLRQWDIFNVAAFVECRKCHGRTDVVGATARCSSVDRAKKLWNKRVVKGEQ